MTEASDWTLWLVLAAAAIAGYFLVSKAVDFFKKDSSWDSSEPRLDREARSAQEAEERKRRFESKNPIE